MYINSYERMSRENSAAVHAGSASISTSTVSDSAELVNWDILRSSLLGHKCSCSSGGSLAFV